jgi:penicillin G amidase
MRLRKWLLGIGLCVVTLLVAMGGWLWISLRGSLPVVDGELILPGLSGAVSVERDAIGVPTITAKTRLDVARALGFVHAQDRFFQMDLSRRNAAGELSELMGPATLPLDRAARLHRMRARAQRALATVTREDLALIGAYSDGVNAGLEALGAKPFEYLLLRSDPVPWRPEDCFLVIATMFFQLQDSSGARESRMGAMYEALPRGIADFLTSSGSEWEAPLLGDPAPPAIIPGPEILDLRNRPASSRTVRSADSSDLWASLTPTEVAGSNNWAVGGGHTATGAAILADDMHLGISVPNTWYRASLAWGDPDPDGSRSRVSGVTLPGVPTVVVGSNGHIAWGFTNATIDLTDLVLVEPDPADSSRYRTPEGPRPFQVHKEMIHVRGGQNESLEVRETIWGPVKVDARGRTEAICWVAHDPEGINLSFTAAEKVRTIEEAFDVANRAGIPAQNFVVATSDGHIGWTIAGHIPKRVGFDGRLPTSWADGSRRWNRFLSPGEYMRILDPPSGRIYTANNRIVEGDFLRVIGDGGYDIGARARQIRDDLLGIEGAKPADMMRVHLDDRALFLQRWRDLAMNVLTGTAVDGNARRNDFRRLLSDSWSGRASVDSVAYRLVRSFRAKTAELGIAPLIDIVRRADPDFPSTPVLAHESPLWELVAKKPAHLLDAKYKTWDDLLLDAVDQTCEELMQGGKSLAGRTWGERNTTSIRHPLSRALPFLSRWLDGPPEQLPGDNQMPRVQGPGFGASERLSVSPGHESEGYFHMPGGQSGHPLSPYYHAGYSAWAKGEPTPFLPGPTEHRLRMIPGKK